MDKTIKTREVKNINIALGGQRFDANKTTSYDRTVTPKQIDVRRMGSLTHTFEPSVNKEQKRILKEVYCDDVKIGDMITTLIVPECHKIKDVIIKVVPFRPYQHKIKNMDGLKVSMFANLIDTSAIQKDGTFKVLKVINFADLQKVDCGSFYFNGQNIDNTNQFVQMERAYEIGFKIENLPDKVNISDISGYIMTGFGYERYLPFSG